MRGLPTYLSCSFSIWKWKVRGLPTWAVWCQFHQSWEGHRGQPTCQPARDQEIKIKKLSRAARDQNGNHEHYLELQESKMKIMIIVERSSPSSWQQSSLASRSAAAWPRRTLPWTEGPSPCPSCRCPSSAGPGLGLWEFLLNQTIM